METRAPGARSPSKGRFILFVGCMGMFVVAVAGQVLPPMLGRIAAEFHQSLTQSGILLMIAPVGYVLSTLVSGYLSDRVGERVFILLGFALLLAGQVLAAWAPVYWLLRAGLLLMGLSMGFLESPLSSLTARAFPERRTEMLNVTQIFYNVGAVVGPAAIGGLFAFNGNWRIGFAGCLALSMASLLLAAKGVPAFEGRRDAGAGAAAPREIHWGLVVALALALLLYVGAEMTVASWSANYLERVFQTPSSRAALAVAGFWFGMMIGRALYVVLVRRTGYLAPLVASAVLAGLAAVGAALAPSAWVAGLLCTLAGFLFGGTWPTILGYAGHRNPGRLGTVFGIIIAAGSIGAVVVPPLAGWVSEHTRHDLRAAMLLAALAAFAEGAIIAGVWLWERRTRRA